MAQDPAVTDEGTRNYDALFASDSPPRVTEEVTIANGENITRGTVLGKVTGGNWKPVDNAQTDGSEVARAVAAEDVDASGGAKAGVIYRQGTFAEEKVTFGGDDAVADHREAAAEKGIYFKSIYEK